MPHSTLHTCDLGRLDSLTKRLPFPLDDGAAVGRLYAEWCAHKEEEARYLIDLWTYCYVRRYFLVKFIRSSVRHSPSDLDFLVERAFRRIERNRGTLREGVRYPRWVVVVCRNTFLNFAARHPAHVSMDRIAEPSEENERLESALDDACRASALESALSRLPRYLRQVATLRIARGLEYEVIAEKTGFRVLTVRAYVHKALLRLRADNALLRVLGYERSPRGSKVTT